MHTKPSINYQIDTKLLPDARIAVVPCGCQNFQKLCHTVLGRLEENGGDFDLVEIWKNSSETGQK